MDKLSGLHLEELVAELSKTKNKSIALQFPDTLLSLSTKVFGVLRRSLPDRKFYVLGDTSYAECCVDDVNASHANDNNLIVKFGPACLSTASKSRQSEKEFIYVIAPVTPDAPEKLKWFRAEFA